MYYYEVMNFNMPKLRWFNDLKLAILGVKLRFLDFLFWHEFWGFKK